MLSALDVRFQKVLECFCLKLTLNDFWNNYVLVKCYVHMYMYSFEMFHESLLPFIKSYLGKIVNQLINKNTM